MRLLEHSNSHSLGDDDGLDGDDGATSMLITLLVFGPIGFNEHSNKMYWQQILNGHFCQISLIIPKKNKKLLQLKKFQEF